MASQPASPPQGWSVSYCQLDQLKAGRPPQPAYGSRTVFYPMDLPSLVHCQQNGLDYRICEVFSDQALYQDVFSRVIAALMGCLYDRNLFKDVTGPSLAEANLLFVPFYELVCLYGGAILKIMEIQTVLDESSDQPGVILEADLREGKILPILEYGEVATAYFAGRLGEVEMGPGSSASLEDQSNGRPSLRRRLYQRAERLYWRVKGLKAFSAWRGGPELGLLSTALDWQEIFEQARTSDWLASVRVIWDDRRFRGEESGPRVIGPVLDQISERVCAAFDYPLEGRRFQALARYAYERHLPYIEHPFTSLLPLARPRPSSKRRRYLLGRAPYLSRERAILYDRYLRGDRIILQEYSDGLNIGLAWDMIHIHKSPIIAELLLYGNRFAPSECLDAFKKLGLLSRLPRAVSVGSVAKAHQPGPSRGRPAGREPCRVYYIPTNLNGHIRVGPHREANDLVWWGRLKKTLAALTALPGVEVVFKAHPKSQSPRTDALLLELLDRLKVPVEFRPLEELGGEIDIAVIDYCGRGFYNCLAAGVPMIYLDFNIKPFFSSSRAYYEKYVRWIDCSLTGDGWLAALKQAVADMAAGQGLSSYPAVEDKVEAQAVLKAIRELVEGEGVQG
ncbi:MAG: hypothetical protein JRC92_08070 [Deltaproteobacteria bacterium]|nr:hypothetical protein [Deltaproteobacteria bacterium]